MTKIAKIVLSLMLVAGITMMLGVTTSCKSEKTMYKSKQSSSKTIHKNYRVRGNNKNNGSTYRTY